MERALRAFAVSVATAGSLVVVKTPSASAHTLCRTMDEAELSESVGTIAGDDTIFVATPDADAAARLARRLAAVLEGPRGRRVRT